MNRSRGRFSGSFRGKIGHNAQQQRSKAANSGHLILPRGVNMFKEESGGRIELDILPYVVKDARHTDRDEEREIAVDGGLWYRRPYRQHRQIGVANASIVCPGSVGRKCPICEYRRKQLDEGADWNDPAMVATKTSARNLYYVIPKGSRKYEEKAYLWDISQFCFQDLLNSEISENEKFETFPGLEDGLTLKLRFSEEKGRDGRSTYPKCSRIDFEERDYRYEEDLIEGLTSLDEVLDLKDYREVSRLFFATDADEDLIDDDAPPDLRRRADLPGRTLKTIARRDRPAARSVAEPDEDDGDDPLPDRRAGSPRSDADLEDDDPPPDFDRRAGASGRAPKTTAADEAPRRTPGGARDPGRDATLRRGRPAAKSELDVDDDDSPRDRPAAKSVYKPDSKVVPLARARSNGEQDNECPSGYQFGVDCDQKPECGECPVWIDCMDAKQAAARP